MTIETTVTEKKKVSREIDLPYYSKHKHIGNYYMIREDESVIKVVADAFDAGIILVKKTPYGNAYLIEDAVKGEPITKDEFEEATKCALEFMDEAMNQLQTV